MTELTPYIDEQLRCVEHVVKHLNTLCRAGHCDSVMQGGLQWLVDEMLFLRGTLHKHPPYRLTYQRGNGIMGLEGDEDTRPG